MSNEIQNWRFVRAGGFDQVRLDTAPELLNIGNLDQKLWVALSCPVKGIEFDPRTLSFIDVDGDGHVRAPDLVAAVNWVAERLIDTSILADGLDGVALSAIKQDDEAGQRIVAAAKEVLAESGSADDFISVAAASALQARLAQLAMQSWEEEGSVVKPLGDATQGAYEAFLGVQEKVDDWFVRCRLAEFDVRAGDVLNATPETLAQLSLKTLTIGSEGIAALPLAKVEPGATLTLSAGINPAWATAIANLHELVIGPMLGARESMTADDWQSIKDKFSAYAEWLAGKPDPSAQSEGARDLEKLARYVRDLMALANNFVAFRDFYGRQKNATFQVGTLYVDGRSCELCVAVNDPVKHAALATLARICLIYVDCVRGAQKMTVAAAMTAGDSDQLMVGRNGVFYDRQGLDWNATITKIVDHPISLRQAFFAPYKRLARMVSEQLQKIAASKAKATEDRIDGLAANVGKPAATATPAASKAAPAPFDVAKFAGIFAAIGLAVGALGTALASIVAGVFALKWWQLPIAFAGLVLLVSGPAVVVAWFKLRSRNLGPILDANGWAINARARINIPFGTSLTQMAVLPPNAERSLSDPYAEKNRSWIAYLVLLTAAALGGVSWYLGWLKF